MGGLCHVGPAIPPSWGEVAARSEPAEGVVSQQRSVSLLRRSSARASESLIEMPWQAAVCHVRAPQRRRRVEGSTEGGVINEPTLAASASIV